MTAETASPATARRLRLLRIRLASLLAALVLVVVTVFAVAVVRLDSRLRTEQNDATLFRQIDDIQRELTFADGNLEPEDPSPVLYGSAAVGIQAAFDITELIDNEDLWDQLPEPTEAELDSWFDTAFFDAPEDIQNVHLLEVAVLDDPDAELEIVAAFDVGWSDDERQARVDDLLANPRGELVDEAIRLFYLDVAERLDLDLQQPVEVFKADELAVPIFEVEELVYRMVDDDEAGPFRLETDAAGGELLARGVVLRDGVEPRGAVLAFVDLTSSEAAHRRLRNQVIALASILVAGSALAAWWLAGRSIRPAAWALGQQERFLAAAAHELRTPVAAIRATAEAPIEPGDDARKPLNRVAELAAGASQLTDDLLILARMDADRLELQTTPTRLDLLVEAAIDDLSLDDSVGSAHRLTAEPVVVQADVNLLTRAIQNLLRNAVIHGGATPDYPATVTVGADGVTVIDVGPGIPADQLETVFERFRSGPVSPGHGLGLPLARWIARAHGGDLAAEPSADGARFHLTLPIVDG